MLYREVLLSAVLEIVCVDNGTVQHTHHTHTPATQDREMGKQKKRRRGPGGEPRKQAQLHQSDGRTIVPASVGLHDGRLRKKINKK